MRLAVCAEMVFLDLPITERIRRITDAGYAGTVGLEAWAADGDSERALARFRAAFTPPDGDLR